MPAHDDPPGGGLAEWALEVERAFAVRERGDSPGGKDGSDLKGIGTPALKQLLARFLGEDSVTDDAFIAFFTAAAEKEDPAILDPDERREQRALAIGGSAWLFAPRVESSDFDLLFPRRDGRRPKGSPATIDTLGTRKAWAYSHYATAKTGSSTLVKGSSKSGDNFRTKFRDALIAAVTRHLADPWARVRADRSVKAGARSSTTVHTFDDELDRLRQVMATAVGRLDQPPARTYPRSMVPSLMASGMSVSRIYRRDEFSTMSGLYSDVPTRGAGEQAISALIEEDRVVILGDPGAGKSTLLRAILIEHLRRDVPTFGVFARLTTLGEILAAGSPRTPAQALAAVVAAGERTMGFEMPGELRGSVPRLLEPGTGRLMIALDGLDEVLNARHLQEIHDVLRILADSPAQILVSSRIAGYEPLPFAAVEVTLDRLEDEQVDAFFDAWFADFPDPTARLRVDAALTQSRDLRELVAIPVMATFAAFVAEVGDLPHRITELYQAYVERYLRREWKELDRRRTDFVEIVDLIAAAADLAWAMATRSSSSPYLNDVWVDSVTLREVLDLVPDQRERIRSLVTIDGLLTPHGHESGGSPLSQQFRWIHRTLHEHLAGYHLSRLLAADRDTALAFIEQAAQRPRSWLQPLAHAYGLLPAESQAMIEDHLFTFRRDGDPGDAILSTVSAFDAHSHEAVRLRGVDYRLSLRARIRAVSQQDARAVLLEALDLLEGSDHDGFIALAKLVVVERVISPDAELVTKLIEWAQTAGISRYEWSGLIDLFGILSPDEAVRMLLRRPAAADGNAFGGGLERKWTRWNVSESALQELLDEAIKAGNLIESLRHVTLLLHLAGGSALLERTPHPVFIDEAAALGRRFLNIASPLSADDRRFLAPIVRGDRGDLAGVVAGSVLYATDEVRAANLDLRGWTATIYGINEFSREAGPRPSENSRSQSELRAVLDAIDDRDITNRRALDELISALRQIWYDGGDDLTIRALARLCVRARIAYNAEETAERLATAVRVDRGDLSSVVHRTLDRQPWDAVWPALAEGWETATGPAAKVYQDIAEMMLPDQPGRSLGAPQRIQEVLDWAAKTRQPVIPALPWPEAPSEFIVRLLADGLETQLAHPDNLRTIEMWLGAEGSLPYWRSTLLRMHSAGAEARQ